LLIQAFILKYIASGSCSVKSLLVKEASFLGKEVSFSFRRH